MKKAEIIFGVILSIFVIVWIGRDLAYSLGYIQEVEHPCITSYTEVIPKSEVKEEKVEILSAEGIRRIYPDGTIQTTCVVVYKTGEKTDTVRFIRNY